MPPRGLSKQDLGKIMLTRGLSEQNFVKKTPTRGPSEQYLVKKCLFGKDFSNIMFKKRVLITYNEFGVHISSLPSIKFAS